MCGRYVRAKEKVELAALFDAGLEEDVPDPSWNIKPTQDVAVVVEKDGERLLTTGRAVRGVEIVHADRLRSPSILVASPDAGVLSGFPEFITRHMHIDDRCPRVGVAEELLRESEVFVAAPVHNRSAPVAEGVGVGANEPPYPVVDCRL